ncbi:MAG: formyltransferase family protein [Chloroflexota bacterium]|nr:formyltransferase family protein [Chloroflexota bacterium]
MLNIGWFSTGRGEGSRGLLRFIQDHIGRGQLNARIQFVFSNRDRGQAAGSDQFFALVDGYGLPLVTRSSALYRRSRSAAGLSWDALRPDYDRLVLGDLEDYRPDICVLAGYMLIVGGEMCRRFSLLNLHPALPDGPIGTWQSVTWELIRRRSTRTGAMIHLATEELDRGPVVSYFTVPIVGADFDGDWLEIDGVDLDEARETRGEDLPLFRRIRRAQYVREPYLILETLRAVADGRVTVVNGSVLDGQGNPLTSNGTAGLCLDEDIGRAMAEDDTT